MSDKLLFTCRVCGCDVDTHPNVENELGEEVGVQGVCPEHCEDHEYEYDSGEHYCKHCNASPPDDWYYCDDDVPLFGIRYEPSEPVGIPASAMDGNAANRHSNPEGWDRWVAFCWANGHD